ncbi:MAG: DUF5615 family PIN-like protein [Pseudomonadota bacterium]
MPRFLVDESLPRAVTRALVRGGHDTLDARDVGLRGKPDEVVAARAVAEQRILVSGDADFSNALRFPPATHPGIVVVRLPDEWSPEARAQRVVTAIDTSGIENLSHSITIVEPVRIRRFRGKP